MNTIINRIKLLEQEADSLNNKIGSEKLLVPRRIESRQKHLLRIINKRIQKYIENKFIGDLDLSNSSIIELPKELIKVDGYLNLYNCTSLESLPNNLKVGGFLNLGDCTSLESLPNNLKVDGDLNLGNCTSLKSLPNNLKVDGYLNLYNCTSLESLPNNLRVDRYLDLYNCTSLESLPNNLQVGTNLFLAGTPIAKKYNTRDQIKNYLNSINANVKGSIYLK